MSHSLAPGFVKLYYTFSTLTHVMTIPVTYSGTPEPGEEPFFVMNDGDVTAMVSAVNTLMPLLRANFAATTEFNRAEAWYKPTDTADPVWIYTHSIGLPGTNATANVLTEQAVISFRTSAGGNKFLYLMEAPYAANIVDPFPFTTVPIANLCTYLTGNDGWIVGRDDGKLVVPIRLTTKLNDALRRKRLNVG